MSNMGDAGEPSSAGAHSGGSAGAADNSGGTSAGGAAAGSGGVNAGSGGVAAGGGSSAGAGGSTAGAGGAADCGTLKTQYSTALDKARACDSGSTDECSKSSTLPALGCGCPTLVNAKSALTDVAKKKYQQLQDNKCLSGPVCAIACVPSASAACSAPLASNSFVCTGSGLTKAQ